MHGMHNSDTKNQSKIENVVIMVRNPRSKKGRSDI